MDIHMKSNSSYNVNDKMNLFNNNEKTEKNNTSLNDLLYKRKEELDDEKISEYKDTNLTNNTFEHIAKRINLILNDTIEFFQKHTYLHNGYGNVQVCKKNKRKLEKKKLKKWSCIYKINKIVRKGAHGVVFSAWRSENVDFFNHSFFENLNLENKKKGYIDETNVNENYESDNEYDSDEDDTESDNDDEQNKENERGDEKDGYEEMNGGDKNEEMNGGDKNEEMNVGDKNEGINEEHKNEGINEEHKDELINKEHKNERINEEHKNERINEEHKNERINEEHKNEGINEEHKNERINEEHKNEGINKLTYHNMNKNNISNENNYNDDDSYDEDNLVSLKIINLKYLSKKNSLKNILREVNFLKMCEHPNVVKYFESFFWPPCYLVIVCEYLSGGTLYDLYKNYGRISEDLLVYILDDVLNGLNYLHNECSSPLIHRDIKPTNIVLSKDGIAKIIDFGSCEELKNSDQSKELVGTIYYISPEILMRTNYDCSSDIWSLGITIYEIVLCTLPWKRNQSFENYIKTIINSSPKINITEGYSKHLCYFVEKCLQKKPENRGNVKDLLNHKFLIKKRYIKKKPSSIYEIRDILKIYNGKGKTNIFRNFFKNLFFFNDKNKKKKPNKMISSKSCDAEMFFEQLKRENFDFFEIKLKDDENSRSLNTFNINISKERDDISYSSLNLEKIKEHSLNMVASVVGTEQSQK
ncbi:hypothetical protein PFHG_05240 [Plasmodium falciparum HB3]|uniref:Protein kinase domain-containing protein n=1 Tax=Plasmodium falciparum (isolate HB3) TaxID=137071 RepID=A0A0L7KK58_PLAFX|nr:hypothetical protein PFHG_05240 [Plasmodium falciparum HB3]